MTGQEIREYINSKADAIFATRMRFNGMTRDMARDEVNAYIQGAVEAFRVMGAITQREAAIIYSDLFRIQ